MSIPSVHTTGTTLFLTSLLGHVFIILDYPAVFADPSLESENTIVLDVEEAVYNLSVEHGRAIFTTKTKILLLPTSSLPTVEDLRRLQADRRSGKPRSSPPLKMELFSIGCVSPIAVNEVSRRTCWFSASSPELTRICDDCSLPCDVQISSVQMDEARVLISYYCQADPLECECSGSRRCDQSSDVGLTISSIRSTHVRRLCAARA